MPVSDTPPLAPRRLLVDSIVVVVIGLVIASGALWAIPFFSAQEPTKVATPLESATPIPPIDKPVAKEPSQIAARPQPKAPADGARPLNLSPPISPREKTFVQKTNVNLRSAPSSSATIASVASKGKQIHGL
jgi:hypothetical protein